MSEFMKSFEAKPEQVAAHEASMRKISEIAEKMQARLFAKIELLRKKNAAEAAAWAKAAAEVSEQLNKDIDGMIEEQLKEDEAA